MSDGITTGDIHVAVEQRLGRIGQRATAARRSLVAVLAATGAPLTIPEILERDDALAQSSAYRNLTALEEAGAVRKVVIGDDHTRYELAEDLTGHHHHMVCGDCGAVADFRLADTAEAALDTALAHAASAVDFEIDNHSLDIVGTCSACA
ncbi:MAG: transcriptional repressor [Acidimicrobiia bacterium]|nr:transcriptional repressor [Acidimicrobiia bacterium]